MSKQIRLLILMWLFVSYSHASGQMTVQGIVMDWGMNPAPVHDVQVEITYLADTSMTYSTWTDAEGRYILNINTGILETQDQTPGAFTLYQNYPNPFNPSTVILYEIPEPARVSVIIYNILGKRMKTLFEGFQDGRTGVLVWDGTDESGEGAAAGIYLYCLKAGGVSLFKKMLLLDGHNMDAGLLNIKPQVPVKDAEEDKKANAPNEYLFSISGNNVETILDTLVITADMEKNASVYRTIMDIDGNVYRIIRIGRQWWMEENLRVTHYLNGDPIPQVPDTVEWRGLQNGAYCHYGNDSGYVATYGRLYNGHAVQDARSIAPDGWHVPGDEEWKEMEMVIGMTQQEANQEGWRGNHDEGGKLKEAGTAHWQSPNLGATNESGFTALPGGLRTDTYGDFGMQMSAAFWTSTGEDSLTAWQRTLHYNNTNVYRYHENKYNGYSIRCVKGPNIIRLISPEKEAVVTTRRPLFDWTDAGYAVTYELRVDNQYSFSSPEIVDSTLTVSEYSPPVPLLLDSYYWKARGKDHEGNWGAWSGVWHFTIDMQAPGAPELLYPENDSYIFENLPTFDWTDVQDAAKYELWVDDDPEFGSPIIQQSALAFSTYTAPSVLTDYVSYYWKVRCRDDAGNWGIWSDLFVFVIASQQG